MLTSSAVVATDAPARYAKQLLSHLGRKNTVEPLDGDADGGRLVFAYGTATLRAASGELHIDAASDDDDGLAHVEDVVKRHLERFGARAELTVAWERAPS
jgi:uncharacterized protein